VAACDSFRILIGMADVTAFVEAPAFSLESDVDIPAGDATDEGRMKSSRFIGSAAVRLNWSTDLRSWAMPLMASVSLCADLYMAIPHQSSVRLATD
jgi:hypothetical protein